MSDLISRDAVFELIESKCTNGCLGTNDKTFIEAYGLIDDVSDLSPVEAVPVVHGEWIRVPSSDMAIGQAYECSNCKKMRYGSFLPPFCQMCGADTRERRC